MRQQKTTRRRARSGVSLPSPAQIAKERSAIRNGWSTGEKQKRRVDAKHETMDPRSQAHLRFIRFLVELEAQNR
ncbi:hypothetical protein SH661x_003782 [Planctomicrobium sp. SH661]|uniref:hypothetical protein n=1 Tax=Planctomicrobium sp. SH661 TaxID=3448124 RepID=UPI003F5BED18